MKTLQEKIFVGLALCLCGLCAYQWYFQTKQRATIDKLDQTIYQQSTGIQGYTNSIRDMDAEIAQLQKHVTDLKQTIVTNEQTIILTRRENARLQSSVDIFSNEIVEYKGAVDKLELTLTNMYQGIQKQNTAIKDLVEQRDDFVKKYNDSIKDRNAIVAQYNDLADRVKKMQAANAASK